MTTADSAAPKLHVAFRFHANFYHSYRGDTLDEAGFGKDIRIIRHIIRVLDEWNGRGVPVRGTWDIENHFSLERIMPAHCPDLVEAIRRRVAAGQDEVEVMSYNNGLISAHTAAEFDAAIGRALTNAAGSGLRDLFGRVAPVVRPQEMMFTPRHLGLYRRHGIEAISLFYSGVPFNAFSNFVPPLPVEQRHNPLRLTYPGLEASMILLPAQNHGDIAENLSFRRWLHRLRRHQLALPRPIDFLLLLDADADDDFWAGFRVPLAGRLLPDLRGLDGLIETAAALDFVTFTTPGSYLATHDPVGTITIAQDTADGSFDGYSSWAEKWSNHRLWTGIERARVLELQTRRLLEEAGVAADRAAAIRARLDAAFDQRLLSLSTTHFGLASPVVNRTRLRNAVSLVDGAVGEAAAAFEAAAADATPPGQQFVLMDYVRGVSTDAVTYAPAPARALVRVPLRPEAAPPAAAVVVDDGGARHPAALRPRATATEGDATTELLFVAALDGGERRKYRLDLEGSPPEVNAPVRARPERLENSHLALDLDAAHRVAGVHAHGASWAHGEFLRSAVTYRGTRVAVDRWELLEAAAPGTGVVGWVRVRGAAELPSHPPATFTVEREVMLAAELPWMYVDTAVAFPHTRSRNYRRERARRLEEVYDGHWHEVMPCEIVPVLRGRPGRPLRVWKHNYFGHVSSYEADYGTFSANRELDAFNNHVTHGWVAVSDGERGLLVAQTADVLACLAFCPMRTRRDGAETRIFLNPFGSYHGRQLTYAAGVTGIGRFLAMQLTDTTDPHAPSYNGRQLRFRLLIAPYLGDAPPEDLRHAALAFAYPWAVLGRPPLIATPAHRRWAYEPGD